MKNFFIYFLLFRKFIQVIFKSFFMTAFHASSIIIIRIKKIFILTTDWAFFTSNFYV